GAAAMAGETHQETSSRRSIATGVMLRRRLSKIFHRDNAEIGLRMYRPDRPRTQGSSQAPICQPPRIQRGRRALSPAYRDGCSSYSVTSLSRAEREYAPSIKSWLRIAFSGKSLQHCSKEATRYAPSR